MDADMPPWLRRAEERLQSGTAKVATTTTTSAKVGTANVTVATKLAQITVPSERESSRATEVTPPSSPTPTPAPAPARRTGASELSRSPVALGLGAKGGVAEAAAVRAPSRLGMVVAGAGVALAVLGMIMTLAGDAEAAEAAGPTAAEAAMSLSA
eukprot:scaffold110839_cov60-Phaeocystis_antarctica.AAC.5